MGDILPGTELLLNIFSVIRSGRADLILFLEFIEDVVDEFTYGGFGLSASDTVRTCKFILLPGISVLLPV